MVLPVLHRILRVVDGGHGKDDDRRGICLWKECQTSYREQEYRSVLGQQGFRQANILQRS
jgi:hypothetical protein